MLEAIKAMLKSKKFHAMIYGILALVFTALSGNMEWVDAIDKSWALVLAYIGAQGIADFGKEKSKVEVAATVPEPELDAPK